MTHLTTSNTHLSLSEYEKKDWRELNEDNNKLVLKYSLLEIQRRPK